MSTIIIPVLIFLILSAVYVHRRLVPATWSKWSRALLFVLILALALALPSQFYLRFALRAGTMPLLISAINYCIGFYSLLLTFTVVRDLFWTLFKISPTHKNLPDNRREFLRQTTRLGILGGSAAVFGYGANRALANPTVNRVQVKIDNLPAALEGLTIVQLSDIHIGQLQDESTYVNKILETANSLKADIMMVTGDIVDGSVHRLASSVAPLSELSAKYGTYFVTGNHEYYSGAPDWIKHFTSIGWRVLENEHTVLNIGSSPVVIAGVHDLKAAQHIPAHQCNPTKALAGAPENAALTLLMAHHPGTAELTENLKIDLQLSGHTHAGQYFPATWVIQYFHKFARGLNRNNDGWVYVNSGTGYWGPPIRTTDIAGEVTHITLVRA